MPQKVYGVPDIVAVVVDPKSYGDVLGAIQEKGFSKRDRIALAALAFQHVAQYDVAVASWLGSVVLPDSDPAMSGFPAWFGGVWERAQTLRYGENPHQEAALYISTFSEPGIAQAEQLHGKEMSYNNYVDADAAYRAAYDHVQPAVAIIKHANPCGIATAPKIDAAYLKANATDPVSAFGGVIAANRTVTKYCHQKIMCMLNSDPFQVACCCNPKIVSRARETRSPIGH